MKTVLFTALLSLVTCLSFNNAAAADPGHPSDEVVINLDGADGFQLGFVCSHPANSLMEKITIFSKGNKMLSSQDDEHVIVFLLDGKTYQMIDTMSNVGMANWEAFFTAIGKTKAKTFSVTIQGFPNVEPVKFPTEHLKKIVRGNNAPRCMS